MGSVGRWVSQRPVSQRHRSDHTEVLEIAVAERRKAQEEALKQLVGVEGREAFMALVNPK